MGEIVRDPFVETRGENRFGFRVLGRGESETGAGLGDAASDFVHDAVQHSIPDRAFEEDFSRGQCLQRFQFVGGNVHRESFFQFDQIHVLYKGRIVG